MFVLFSLFMHESDIGVREVGGERDGDKTT